MDKSSEDADAEAFLSVRIDLATRQRLEELAKENERSLAGEIRLALRAHLEATERAA